MQPHSVYGFADNEDVEKAVVGIIKSVKKKTKLVDDMGRALLDINAAIPVQSKHRHLVANALENFVDAQTK